MTRKPQGSLRIGVLSQNGNFILNVTQSGNLKIIGGYEARFLDMLMEGLHSQPIIYTKKKDEWGKPLENGNWTGLIGMVYRGEIDMAISSILITQGRMEVVDFSYPYSIEEVTFGTRLPRTIPRANALIGPFSQAVWLSLITSLFMFSAVACVLMSKKQSFGKAVLSFFGSILNQPLSQKSYRISERILLGAWLCGTVFLSKSYSSYLLSFLTLPTRETVIKNVNQLSKAVATGNFKCYTTKESSILDSLFLSLQEDSIIIAKAIKYNNWLLESNNSLFVKYVHEKNSAIIRTRRYIHNLLQGTVFISDDSFYSAYAAIVLPKNSPLKARVNQILSKIDASGVYLKSCEDYLFLKHLRKKLHANVEDDVVKSITLKDLQGAFLFLISGYTLALVVFFIELILRKIYK